LYQGSYAAGLDNSGGVYFMTGRAGIGI
jgi:hypothetical protein